MGGWDEIRSVGRVLAAVSAGAFIGVSVAYSVIAFREVVLREEIFTWLGIGFLLAYATGAALLTLGVMTWFGSAGYRLRGLGFVILLLMSIVNVSLAVALIPLVLLAVPSLRRFDRSPAAGTRDSKNVIEPRGQTSA
jgi:MFS family permease